MTTQIKPTTGGAYTTVTLDSDKSTLSTSTGMETVAADQVGQACQAVNEWVNAGGTGTHADLATKKAAAVGLLIQEV